jgi:hypothetical protein
MSITDERHRALGLTDGLKIFESIRAHVDDRVLA